MSFFWELLSEKENEENKKNTENEEEKEEKPDDLVDDNLEQADDIGNIDTNTELGSIDTDEKTETDDLSPDEPNAEELDTDTTETDLENDTPMTLKYKTKKLLKSYVNLYNIIDETKERIALLSGNNTVETISFKKLEFDLESIKNSLYDYIVDMYKDKSYAENLYNFYNFQNSVKLCIQILEKLNNIKEDK